MVWQAWLAGEGLVRVGRGELWRDAVWHGRRGGVCYVSVSWGEARRGIAWKSKRKDKETMTYEYSWSGPQRAVSAEKVAKHIAKLEKK